MFLLRLLNHDFTLGISILSDKFVRSHEYRIRLHRIRLPTLKGATLIMVTIL